MNKITNITLSTLASLTLGGCINKNLDISNFSDNVSEKTGKLLSNNNKEGLINKPKLSNEIMKSIGLVGKNDIVHFVNYFNLEDSKSFYSKVNEIQVINGLKKDGIIGPETLKSIYLSIYINEDISKLSFTVQKRLEIYKDMEGYKTHPGKPSKYGRLFPTNVPDIFSKNYFYGMKGSENIEGSFINKDLLKDVYENVENKGITAYLEEVESGFIVVIYIDGELKLLSYTSPGSSSIDGGVRTRKGLYSSKSENMYYISSARSSIFRTRYGLKGAIMPYAVHIDKGTHAHAGFVDGGRKSHGCVRLPIFYAKGMHDIFKKYGEIQWVIKKN